MVVKDYSKQIEIWGMELNRLKPEKMKKDKLYKIIINGEGLINLLKCIEKGSKERSD